MDEFYSLCDQTVTVYHRSTDGEISHNVYGNAFFDFKKTQNVDKLGSREVNGFLLVIPGDVQTVYVGDKVLHGTGPPLYDAKEWANFIPAKVPGLCVVAYADPKYFGGKLVHTEAGG